VYAAPDVPGSVASPKSETHDVASIVDDEDATASGLSLPFRPQPYREFGGHTGAVYDLSWSSNLFLVSGSRDRTVRLWHVYRDSALKVFRCARPLCPRLASGLSTRDPALS
jgi:WD40 repeat protein